MNLTKKSFLKPLDVEQDAYQWINNNFESKLVVHGDINIFLKGIDKELLEKAFYSLLIAGIFDINAEQLRNILIYNPDFNINGKDKNFRTLIEGFMLNLAEIQEVSNIFELGLKNMIITSSEVENGTQH
jgi:hypothetical protein